MLVSMPLNKFWYNINILQLSQIYMAKIFFI